MRTQILYVAVLSLLVGGAVGAGVGGKAQAETEDRTLALLCKRFELTAARTRDLAAQSVRDRWDSPTRVRDLAIRDTLNAVEVMVCPRK